MDDIGVNKFRAQRRVLSRLDPDRFVDREATLKSLVTSANSTTHHHLLLGPRHVGKTELLLQLFDTLFERGDQVVAVYFSCRRTRADFHRTMREFTSQLIRQVVAFRQREPRFAVDFGIPLDSVVGFADREDFEWLRALLDLFNGSNDTENIFNAAELVAAHSGLKVLILLDNLHNLEEDEAISGAKSCGSAVADALVSLITAQPSHSRVSFVVSGLERSVSEVIPSDESSLERLRISRMGRLPDQLVEEVIHRSAAASSVEVSDSTAELMSQQLKGDLFYIASIIDAAAARGIGLKTFVDFERIYASELLEGRIGQYFVGLLRSVSPGFHHQRALIETLRLLTEAEAPVPLDAVVERIRRHNGDPELLLTRLHRAELLDLGYGFVTPSSDFVVADYVRAVYRREITGAYAPVSGGELLRDKLKSSYRLMMSRFNRTIESQLVEILSSFDFQNVPASLFDIEAFNQIYQGLPRLQARAALETEEQRVRLPQVVMVKNAGASDYQGVSVRFFLGSGFEGGIYSDSNEVQWLVALINSREPVNPSVLAGVDHLAGKSIRVNRDQEREHQIRWYISREGFTSEAIASLDNRSVRFSSFAQLDLLHDLLFKHDSVEEPSKDSNEFELVIPIDDEAELIAARTVEQIARAADFDQQTINQIKTALIEACINAAEHSDTPDRRIYQRFSIKHDRLIVRVRNKGKTFDSSKDQPTPRAGVTAGSLRGSRGRGLQIIRALMDEVHFERTDDGTSLVMTKYLKRPQDQ